MKKCGSLRNNEKNAHNNKFIFLLMQLELLFFFCYLENKNSESTAV